MKQHVKDYIDDVYARIMGGEYVKNIDIPWLEFEGFISERAILREYEEQRESVEKYFETLRITNKIVSDQTAYYFSCEGCLVVIPKVCANMKTDLEATDKGSNHFIIGE